ncbi:Gfo/Idh/MocA family protein [Natronobiforma cellulositropha]|uniref:Gfo/Idh/MocA family protein n=1 Tax=Natronobiforma cellulositropha TaxID=1679076 RepID=UPI0021D5A8D9|nr:Gfo/Idh/MocA family oxidoreductase [Natronobiforma cellulositropha]
MTYRVAVVGTGTEPENPNRDGYAMAYHHADGYERLDECELVACADIVEENAAAFADAYDIDEAGIFTDYATMLETAEPDVVSLCVPPSVHAAIAVDCIRSGVVEAIHCEKPMADTYGGARLMAQEALRHDVQLTFNHQRRFSQAVRTAKSLLDDGEIGRLERVEFQAYAGLLDYGSHSFDLCSYFVDETPGSWVLAQVDYGEENRLFGTHNENRAIVSWEYENGVHGIGVSDSSDDGRVGATIGCHNRLCGSEGTIELGAADADAPLRIRRSGDAGWETVDTGDGLHDWEYLYRAIAETVRCLETGTESELGAKNALNATELIFGAYESARRRGRVDLPLDIEDNPLVSMVDSGALRPEPRPDTEDS